MARGNWNSHHSGDIGIEVTSHGDQIAQYKFKSVMAQKVIMHPKYPGWQFKVFDGLDDDARRIKSGQRYYWTPEEALAAGKRWLDRQPKTAVEVRA